MSSKMGVLRAMDRMLSPYDNLVPIPFDAFTAICFSPKGAMSMSAPHSRVPTSTTPPSARPSRRWGIGLTAILWLTAVLALAGCKRAQPPVPATEGPVGTAAPTVVDSGFPIADSGEPLPPQVIERHPARGQELSLHGEITLVFDQAMAPTDTAAAWQLLGPEGAPIPGEITWKDPRSMVFKPGERLNKETAYRATLDQSARSRQGVPLTERLEFQFETVGDLQISQTFPPDATKDVASSAVITAIFNRPVVPLVTAEERGRLANPLEISPPVSGRGEWVSTSVFVFRPDRALRGGTSYTVTIQAGLADAAGETTLPADYVWGFVTLAPSIESLELSSGPVNPEDHAEDILLDEAFIINFSQPMDKSSANAALRLAPVGGSPVSTSKAWDDEGTRLTITPTRLLDLDRTYTLALSEKALASDGNPLRSGLSWTFSTIPSPSVVLISPPEGQVGQGFRSYLTVKFASPMRIDSVKDRIVIIPRPEGDVQWWYNEYDRSISANVLEPSTAYEVHTLPGMQDIYGNETATERTVRFTTASAPPMAGLQMPHEPAVLRPDGPQEFYVTYRNVNGIEVELYRTSPAQFISLLTGALSQYSYQPAAGDLVWRSSLATAARRDDLVLKSLQPSAPGGGELSPGFYFLSLDTPTIPHQGSPTLDRRLVVVGSADLIFKTTTNEALVWVTGLQTGEPIPDVPLIVYDKDFREIGRGRSDSEGLAIVRVPTPSEAWDPRFVMTDGEGAFGFASSQWGSGVDLYDYGLWSSWYAPGNQPKVYLYTDRPIYRPGQPVHFKGILRLDDDLDYGLPSDQRVQVRIDSFKETVYEAYLPLSDLGTFDGQITLDPESALGHYTIGAYLPGSSDSIGGTGFTVAEYHKPEFQVQASASPTDVLAGDPYAVAISADYYSGGGVAEAQVEWTLSSSPYTFTPTGQYSGYSFMDYGPDMDTYAQASSTASDIIASGEGRTDADGELSLSMSADLSAYNSSRQFTLEATVTDITQNAVSGRASITAHRSEIYPGVRPTSYVGTVNQEASFDLVALDWDGDPVPDQELEVQILEQRWYSVQEQDATGRIQWKSTLEETPVASVQVITDPHGRSTVSFTPLKGGAYKALAVATDAAGNQGRAGAILWVAGSEFIPWRQTNDRSFELITDRKSYSPGDAAEILIASPFQGESYALVTLERGHIYSHEVLRLTNNSTLYELPVTSEMAPNTYLSVVVVKGVDETNPRPNFKMGIVEISVDTREQQILVGITPDRPQAGPGDKVTYTVSTRDMDEQPVDAELSLGVSDLATLSLVGPNSPPILDFFYNHRTLGVWTSVPISLSLEDYNATISEQMALGEGMGSGGGKGEGELGVVEVRQEFPDTAFWNAHVQTGADGQATVSVTLPDNLTTWRMDARAVTRDTRVGQATHDLVSTRSLLVRPQTPRFLVAGDQVRFGAAVHNNTGQALSVEITLDAKGVSLQDNVTQQIELPANRQAYVTWDAIAEPESHRVDLVFSAEGRAPTGERYTDASRPPLGTLDNQGLPVYRYEAFETVGTSGQMTAPGTQVEAIRLPQLAAAPRGDLTIEVAPSLAAAFTDGLTYLEEFRYSCVEQTISRFLPNVVSARALKAAGLSDPDLETEPQGQVNTAMQRLSNWQNPDGGWGWWPSVNQESDVVTSAYVVLGLVEAEEAGYSASQAMLRSGIDFLRASVPPIRDLDDPSLLNQKAFVLYVLARAGRPDVSAAVQLFDQRLSMAIYARALLARAMYLEDPKDPRVQTLLTDLASVSITSATGTHWEEPTPDPANWNTDTRTTAILLSTLSQIDVENPLNANAVRWLMSHRTEGRWLGTQETAWTLMGLTGWMEASGELGADYQYAIALNGERLGGGFANRETLRQTHELRIDLAELLTGELNRLAIARGDGPGNLYYTAHLAVALPVAEVSALDQGITISRSYYTLDGGESDPSTSEPIGSARQGDLVLVRLTVVAPNALHNVMVEDPLPAGLEAVDQSLEISPQRLEVPQNYRWEDVFSRGWGWWYFEHTQLKDEKVLLSASYLPAGTYVYTYLARASTVGTFNVIPPVAQEFYFPEVHGRGEGGQFAVTP
jgi:uncharacterized protein YfaS (alpha-2-macroglobulin family)